MALVISFVLEMKGVTEVFMVISFLYYHYGGMQANGVIREGRSTGVGGDRMIEMILFFLYGLMFG